MRFARAGGVLAGARLNVVALSLALSCGVSQARAQALSQDLPGHGKINWTDKTITVTGTGAPNLKAANVAVARVGAERAAKLDAFRNILEAVKGVKVSGNQTAGAAMESSAEVKAKVEGVIRNFKVLDTKYYSDGGVDVIVQVPLADVTEALIGDRVSKGAPSAAANGGASGVIINAKGLSLSPGLAPRILSESGAELFASGSVQKNAVKRHGVCGYHTTLEKAKEDERIGSKPLVLKAVKAAEKGGADVVISDEDGKKLAALGGVLAQGKLVIVTD